MPDAAELVRDNLQRVQERMAAAAEAAGRSPNDVRMVGVTKYVGVEETKLLIQAGCSCLGESRPQMLWEKVEALSVGPFPQQWHLIGHLQRNKVPRTIDCTVAVYVHSVDSPRLLSAIDRAVEGLDWQSPALLEVNVSGDPEKHGLSPDGARELVGRLGEFANVRVLGLMTMAAREGGASVARRNFAELRELRDEIMPGGELSMGMSGDFEEAIAEGATIVRVGSALWEGINRESR